MASSSKSEQSYILSSFHASPPLRADGRALHEYRPIALETQVAPLANGSAKVNIGGGSFVGVGGSLPGTEVLAAVKLEVEDIVTGKGVEGGRLVCTVSCSPSAYPNLNNNALDDLQFDLTAVVQESLTHSSLRPKNLTILPGKKSWLLHLDLVVLSDNGNIYDALFLAAAASLRDTRVPRTRSIEYRARKDGSVVSDRLATDVSMGGDGRSGLDTRETRQATDFELADYWDEGEPLACGGTWPVPVTLNIVSPVHYLDATSLEEDATPLRLLLLFSYYKNATKLQGMRLLGPGEANVAAFAPLLRQGETYARELKVAFEGKLETELNKRYRKQQGLKSR